MRFKSIIKLIYPKYIRTESSLDIELATENHPAWVEAYSKTRFDMNHYGDVWRFIKEEFNEIVEVEGMGGMGGVLYEVYDGHDLIDEGIFDDYSSVTEERVF